MARAAVWIDGKKYRVLSWQAGQRPSQAADPSALVIAEWRIDGPMGPSYEDITEGYGYLGVDYPSSVDTRWQNTACLGPEVNSVTLTTSDKTWTNGVWDSSFVWDSSVFDSGPDSANISGLALMEGAGTVYLYILRGRYVTKVDVSDMTVKETHILPEAGTSILATTTATGVRELSVGMPNHAYHVMTSVATPPSTDTWVVNSGNLVASQIGWGNDRVVLAGKDNLGVKNVVSGIALTGPVTMANPTASEIATLPGSVTVTGFGLDGPFYVIMTDEGPYVLDEEKREFFQLIPELPRSMENRVVGNWFPWGTLFGLATGARYSKFGSGESYGLEKFRLSTGPIEGFMTAQTASARWNYEAWQSSVTTGETHIVAWQDRQPGDGHAYSIGSPFPIVDVGTSTRCNAMLNIDTANGKRTSPTIVLGKGADALNWFTLGRNVREINDTLYRFENAGGEVHLTEMRRYPGMIKQLQAVEFETADCTAARTITVHFDVDGASDINLAAVTSNGWQRQLFVDGSAVPLTTATTRYIKPYIAFATDSGAASPKLHGPFRLHFKVRPILTEYVDTVLLLEDSNDTQGTSEAQEDVLFGLDEGSTVQVLEDLTPSESWYADVEEVTVVTTNPTKPGAEDRPSGYTRTARVRLIRWPTASGE